MAVIGIGIDLLEVDRAEKLLLRKGNRALDRLLTPAERNYVATRLGRPAQHLAVRITAKEAVYKALQALPGARSIGWRDIEVEHTEARRPLVRLHGQALAVTAPLGDFSIHLSLTHSHGMAGAVAVIEGSA